MRDHRVRVRLHIIHSERIENVGNSQPCMVSELRILYICKQTVGMSRQVAISHRLRDADLPSISAARATKSYTYETESNGLTVQRRSGGEQG